MLSKSIINFIKSLHYKKNRQNEGLFIVEGVKSINDLLNSNYVINSLFYTKKDGLNLEILSQNIKIFQINEQDLSRISTLTNPQQVLAIAHIPDLSLDDLPKNNFSIMIDGIQDPGNLGTIIRTADWFGIKKIICSLNTVDSYNPKVIQASMGSFSRIQTYYTDLPLFLSTCNLPVYGALLSGTSIYQTNFQQGGILILGNEGNGISNPVLKYIQHGITIPRYGQAESLNVAISTGIFCSEIKRPRNSM